MGDCALAGEPLLYATTTGLVVADEPGRERVDTDLFQKYADHGVAIALAARLPVLDLRVETSSDAPFVADDALVERIKAMGRRSLIVCGALLEGAVTQVSLGTLMDGYDVFVPADLVLSAEPRREQIFLDRITSCGGNIMTRTQIILELLSVLKSSSEREPLEQLLRNDIAAE